MMQHRFQASFLALFGLFASAKTQSVCSLNAEGKPSLVWQTCTSSGCTTNNGQLVIDANWRWAHSTSSATNCYTGNTWDATLCPSDTACAANCCLDGSGGYQSTYGVSTSGNAATLEFVTVGAYATNIGSRLYLMASDTEYQMFNLLGKEFTFDVNVANLGCGLNGALYFVSMDADGGKSKYPANKAGAAYGTGYCDTQCAMDLKWINGLVSCRQSFQSSRDFSPSNSFSRAMSMAGNPPPTTRTRASASSAAAAMRSISGRQTRFPTPLPSTRAVPRLNTCAMVLLAAALTRQTATEATVTRTAATGTPTGTAPRTSLAPV